MEARPALTVTITDSLNPSKTAFTNVSVIAIEGAFRDSVFVASTQQSAYGRTLSLAHEHSGRFTVRVRADGYAVWEKSGIDVQKDQCHVVTVPVTARLE
jgi:hypothetical protein